MRERRENSSIDYAQKKAASVLASKIELIILGTGDSGKTTLRKQLSNVHNKQFQDEKYRKTFASTIVANLIDGVLEVLTEMAGSRSSNEQDDERLVAFATLSEITRTPPPVMDEELATMLRRFIHEDPEFQQWTGGRGNNNKQRRAVQLQDCWFEFAEKLKAYPEWGGPGWIPDADDCVRSRVRTSGVIKEELVIDGLDFVLYDVGGQRAERRKWMHMFDSVLSCIYVAALSEYDQVLFEDRTKNRLEEALELFSDAINSPWFSQATTLLFLNKKDLFHQKYSIDRIPLNLSGCFPGAPLGNDDEDGAIGWISNEFTTRKRQGSGRMGKVFVHVTTATDPKNIKAVFRMARETILGKTMRAVGFVSEF
jgi:GTPase SAR1 family protein